MRFISHHRPAMRLITAKLPGTCHETGKAIERGQEIVFDPVTKRVFHADSRQAQDQRGMNFAQAWNMPDANY